MIGVPPAELALEPPAPRPRLSPGVTLLCALILVLFVAWTVRLHQSSSRVEAVADPEQALALVVSRGMDLREALAAAPPWERRLHQAISSDGSDDLAQAIAWYEELQADSLDPSVDLHLAILDGEAGDVARARQMIEEWERRDEPLPSFAAVVRTAYVGSAPESSEEDERATLAEVAPGWFADRLAIAWGKRVGDATLVESARERLESRAHRLRWRLRLLAAVQLAVVVAGLATAVALVWRGRRRRPPLTVSDATLPPPWSGGQGLVVLIRGGAAAALVIVALILLDGLVRPWVELENPIIEAAIWPLMYVPVLLLARRHLLRPAGIGFVKAMGLRVRASGWRSMVVVVLVLLALAALVVWLLTLAGAWLGVTSHWSEWFDEQLVWGDASTVAANVVGAVVLAPVFEEAVFRGLLFATLRRVLGFAGAAGLSAAIFAVAHGYGALGFVDVFLSGILWAWAFERTGSLVPGIVAHATTNLLVSVTVVALLR